MTGSGATHPRVGQRAVPAARLRVIRESAVGPASPRVTLGAPNSNSRAQDEEVHVPVFPRNQQGNIAVQPAVDTDTPPEEVYGEFIGGTFLIGVPFIGSSCSVCLNTGRRNFLALSLNEAIKHAKERH
ncbi:hypothetical protein HHI36_024048 [Cryptolaemus montrouzieri]|uniref:Uncharacterized protein n=1 Tax=Cryptolaemus montrouzieri TaxID=559131 RepID=A0ABD2NIY8_9CUCU